MTRLKDGYAHCVTVDEHFKELLRFFFIGTDHHTRAMKSAGRSQQQPNSQPTKKQSGNTVKRFEIRSVGLAELRISCLNC
jgi:hypothetical protein